MPKGVAEKGFKMTQNRRNILNLLIEEGGAIKSKEGKATSLMHGLLEHKGSMVSLNATLRELENLGFIERGVEGRRTYEIKITDLARQELGADAATPRAAAAAVVETEEASAPVSSNGTDHDWDDQPSIIPGSIDYDVLLGVFLKAALRGMEGSSNGELAGEVNYLKTVNQTQADAILRLTADVDKFRAEAAQAIAERDQLQKNLNVMMSRAEQGRTGRGMDPIRKLLKPDERAALDALMRQIPTRQGD